MLKCNNKREIEEILSFLLMSANRILKKSGGEIKTNCWVALNDAEISRIKYQKRWNIVLLYVIDYATFFSD